MGEAGRHVEGLGSAVHEIVDNDPHHVGEALAAVFRVPRRRGPAVFAIKLKRLPVFRRAANLPVFVDDTPFFPDLLKGFHDSPGEFDGLLDQHIQGIFVQLTVSLKGAEGTIIQLLFQNKKEIFLVYLKMTHGSFFSFLSR